MYTGHVPDLFDVLQIDTVTGLVLLFIHAWLGRHGNVCLLYVMAHVSCRECERTPQARHVLSGYLLTA